MHDANQYSSSHRVFLNLPLPWWIALFVLVANDHYFKSSNLMAGWITGKISDFAGLFVAPFVAAALLRVKKKSTWLQCHIVIGSLFAGLQLVPELARVFESLMGFIYIPSHVTSDPSDLVALPILVLSFYYFNHQERKSSHSPTPPQTYHLRAPKLLFQQFGLVCGALACLASSQVSNDISEDNAEPQFGSIFLHNNSDIEITLFTRSLDQQRFVDCMTISQSPGLLLRESNFSNPQQWSLSARSTVPLADSTFNRPCHAILVEGEHLSPAIVFWWQDAYPNKEVPARSPPDEALERGVLSIEFDEQGKHTGYRHDFGILHHAILPIQPQSDPNCTPAAEEARLDWSDLPEFTHAEIQSINALPDGCIFVELLPSGAASAMPQSSAFRWHLCIPPLPFPFANGEQIEIQHLTVSGTDVPGNVDGLLLRKLGEFRDANDASIDAMILSRGDGIPVIEDLQFNRLPLSHCSYTVDANCGTAIRNQWLQVTSSDQSVLTLVPNAEPLHASTNNGRSVNLYLSLGHERAIADQVCLSSHSNRSHDFELVATIGTTQP